MIQLQQGDILKAEAEALVNTVNCVGVMGRGIALQFKKAYPDNFKMYKAVCDRKELRPGRMLIYDTNRLVMPRYIINSTFGVPKVEKSEIRISKFETNPNFLMLK